MKKTIELFTDQIKLQNETFLVERVRNLDDMVDQISDELFAEDERLPYWAELWPSAYALAEFILGNKKAFYNQSILELGCGLGLTTLALAGTDAASLLATDYEKDALLQTEKNFALNKLKRPQLKLLDWREPDLDRTYKCIVASDVAYEQRFFEPLIHLFKTYLEEDGKIFLAEPNRAIARTFFGKLALNGFCYSFEERYIEQLTKKIKISIYTIRFKNGKRL